jgi:hypothetical protein
MMAGCESTGVSMEMHKEEAHREIGKPWNATKLQNIILVGISALFIVALAVKLLLNISRIDFVAEPPSMFPDGLSTTTVKAVPHNALGLAIPFKPVQVFYEIEEGGEKVEIVGRDRRSITLRAKRESGNVVLHARLAGDAIPYEIVIQILPQYASWLPQ